MTNFTEDLTFPFAGFWKGTVGDLIQGDGFRLTADEVVPCLFVEDSTREGDEMVIFHTIRSVHVARVLGDALGRILPESSSNPGLSCLRLPASTPCWIRI